MNSFKPEKRVLAAGCQAWDGSRLPDYPGGEADIIVTRICIPPHTRLDMHVHPVINAGMVIAGELTVTAADGPVHTFGPGEAIIEIVGRPHYGENRGDTPVDLVMFYASTPGTPLSLPSSAS